MIDTEGTELFVLEDKMVSYLPKGFSSGLALVIRNNNEAYFIDKAGNKRLDLGKLEKENGVGYFRGDIAPLFRNGKWRFIDKAGKLLPEEYEKIDGLDVSRKYPLDREHTWVSKKNKKSGEVLEGYVNGRGEVLIPIEHTSAFPDIDKATNTTYIKVEKKDRKGNILVGGYDINGKLIKPFEPKK